MQYYHLLDFAPARCSLQQMFLSKIIFSWNITCSGCCFFGSDYQQLRREMRGFALAAVLWN